MTWIIRRILTVQVDRDGAGYRGSRVIVGGLARKNCMEIAAIQFVDVEDVANPSLGEEIVGVVQQRGLLPPGHTRVRST